jgi:hypothetical protein
VPAAGKQYVQLVESADLENITCEVASCSSGLPQQRVAADITACN